MSDDLIKINEMISKLTPEEKVQILELGHSNYFYNIIEHFIITQKYKENKKTLFKDAYVYCNVEGDIKWYKNKSYKSDFVKIYRLINRLSKKLNAEELDLLEDCLIKDCRGYGIRLHDLFCR